MITASMRHTEQTLRRLSKTQYDTFCFGRKAGQAVCGLILIGMGIAGGSAVLSVLCLFAGCWLCMNTDVPARVRADKVISSMNGRFPCTRYRFSAAQILLDAEEGGNEESPRIPYASLIRLVEDEGYLYLYISKLSAYMIDKATISPDVSSLKELIGQQSGLRWTRPTSFFNFSLRTLLAGHRKPGRPS